MWAQSLSEIDDDQRRLTNMFYAATGRKAQPSERASLRRSLQKARYRFEKNPDEASKLISIGNAPNESDKSKTEQAAWTTMCLLLLNLDETLCK